MSIGSDPFLSQVLEGVFLNMPAAFLLLHVRKHVRKGRFHASVVVCDKNMDLAGVTRQLKAYFLEKVS